MAAVYGGTPLVLAFVSLAVSDLPIVDTYSVTPST